LILKIPNNFYIIFHSLILLFSKKSERILDFISFHFLYIDKLLVPKMLPRTRHSFTELRFFEVTAHLKNLGNAAQAACMSAECTCTCWHRVLEKT